MIDRILRLIRFMALAVNDIDRRGPSNEMNLQLQPNKTNVMLY